MLLTSNCSDLVLFSTTEDDAFVLLSVLIAFLSFFLNLAQLVVLVQQRLLCHNRHLIMAHLCIVGQLAAAAVLVYLHRAVKGHLFCHLLPSALHLLTLFTFAPLITLLVVHHHHVARPTTQCLDSRFVVALLIVLGWCEALLISLAPLLHWHDCHLLSLAWSPRFAAIVCLLYFLHYPIVLILLVDLLCHRQSRPPLEVCLRVTKTSADSKELVILVTLYAVCTLPFVCHMVLSSFQENHGACWMLLANERTTLWTSWLTTVFAAIRPLFHTMVEEDIGNGTVSALVTVCRLKKKPNAISSGFLS